MVSFFFFSSFILSFKITLKDSDLSQITEYSSPHMSSWVCYTWEDGLLGSRPFIPSQ